MKRLKKLERQSRQAHTPTHEALAEACARVRTEYQGVYLAGILVAMGVSTLAIQASLTLASVVVLVGVVLSVWFALRVERAMRWALKLGRHLPDVR